MKRSFTSWTIYSPHMVRTVCFRHDQNQITRVFCSFRSLIHSIQVVFSFFIALKRCHAWLYVAFSHDTIIQHKRSKGNLMLIHIIYNTIHYISVNRIQRGLPQFFSDTLLSSGVSFTWVFSTWFFFFTYTEAIQGTSAVRQLPNSSDPAYPRSPTTHSSISLALTCALITSNYYKAELMRTKNYLTPSHLYRT